MLLYNENTLCILIQNYGACRRFHSLDHLIIEASRETFSVSKAFSTAKNQIKY
jgi:hypothetical protein